MPIMKECVLSVFVLVASSLQAVRADGGADQSGAIGGVIGFIILISICAICCYRRCCQRNNTVVYQPPPAAVAAAQNVQQIQIVAPPAQQFVPIHPQQPMMSPTGGHAPMPMMGAPNAPQYDAPPPPSYFEK